MAVEDTMWFKSVEFDIPFHFPRAAVKHDKKALTISHTKSDPRFTKKYYYDHSDLPKFYVLFIHQKRLLLTLFLNKLPI